MTHHTGFDFKWFSDAQDIQTLPKCFNLCCDIDLEHSNPTFSLDTYYVRPHCDLDNRTIVLHNILAHGGAPQYCVWLTFAYTQPRWNKCPKRYNPHP